ncbi:response regulator [Pigmentiphaga litoralis]|uniref:hybrid sensor histidine kinase/response regulator n=1 Tax=Pigmentiphaga litoralis TaxID=516702 RepID=UPI003B429872
MISTFADLNPDVVRILMVEDDPRDADLALQRLELAGLDVRVTVVDTADAFLAELDRSEFDIVLSDFQLPTFSGPEALRLSQARPQPLPFVFVSGVLGEENAVDMLREGATDYVLKQRLERLPIVVRRALAEATEKRSRQDAERKLRERETYFGQLIDALRDYSVIALSTTGVIESWNQASEWIFGYGADEVLGKTYDMFFVPDDALRGTPQAMAQALTQELALIGAMRSMSEERWLRRKNGTSFYASVVTTAIFGDDGEVRGFSRIVRDMTDTRVAADLLQAAKEQAENANRAKDHFLAVLSHELRTPLGPIYAAAQALDMQTDLPPKARRSVELIKRNVEIEARLIDDLLDISKIVNDKLTLHFEPTDLVALLGGMADVFRDEAAAQGIELLYTPLATPVIVQADPARLQQVLWNLLKNAIKFTQKAGTIRLALLPPRHGKVTVEVSDTGIGIQQEALKRIFNAFDQGDNEPGEMRGGLGLGLAIASSLAQRHGGTLNVHSDGVGRGATFTLTLNYAGDASERASGVVTPVPAGSRRAPVRLLLVEDNADTAEAMQFLLSELGYMVKVAVSVADARSTLAAHTFDALVSDMGLPDGDGIDVLRMFDRTGGKLAIALTGYGMEADVQRCLAAGFDEHLTKPLDIDRLTALLGGEAT